MSKEHNQPTSTSFGHRVAIAAGIVLLFVAFGAAFAKVYDIFFLFFAAILLAVLFRAASDAVNRWTGWGPRWSYIALLIVVFLVIAGMFTLAGAMLVSQFDEFAQALPRSVEQLRAYLQQFEWGRTLLQNMPTAQNMQTGVFGNVATQTKNFFTTTFGILGNLFVLSFLALYMAATPRLYVGGLVRLVPRQHRPRAEEVLHALGFHLKWWLYGRALAMLTVGVITGVGLWIAGVPQFLILGIVAGILSAVPFIGAILAAIPGILIALMQGPETALGALAAYTVSQLVENYLVTPLVQQDTVNLPPAIAIGAITIIGALFGVLGLIVASPLAVVVLVLVKMLYVEDLLGDELDVKGTKVGSDPAT